VSSSAGLELIITLKDEASRGMDEVAGKASFLGQAFAFATGGLIQEGISRVAGAVSDLFGGMIDEASEAQDGLAQLTSVLQATGGAAGVTAQQVLDLSSNLSAENGLSKFTDDAILAGENLLLTFKNIGGDVFPMATQALVDMGQAMGTGPQEEAIRLGKALNDPIAGLSALSRVGVTFSDSQKEAIESMVKMGDTAGAQKAILAELTSEFGGSAAAAAGTFSGQMMTLREMFAGFQETVGTALMPALQSITSALTSSEVRGAIQDFAQILAGGIGRAIQFISTTAIPAFISGWRQVAPAVESALQGLRVVGAIFVQLASQAIAWGQNIGGQLAAGIGQSISTIVAMLRYVGAVIASWLRPGSPPKILPGLDQWGKQAMEVYVGGMTNADLSMLQDFGGTLRDVLTGLVDSGEIDQADLIPRLLGGREGFAAALQQLEQFGQISQETFDQIVRSAGSAGPEIANLLNSYADLSRATADVAEAQRELNAVTDEYNSKLKPLNKELKDIQDQKQAIDDQIRIKKLQEDIASGKLDDLETQKAQLEIQEIQKREQISAVEEERDAAVDAAQEKLDAAEESKKKAEEAIRAQQAQLSVYNEQTKLMESLAKASAGGGGGGAKGIDIKPPEVPKDFNPFAGLQDSTSTLSDVTSKFDEFVASISGTSDEIQSTVTPIMDTLNSGFETFNNVISPLLPIIAGVAAAFGSFSILSTVAGWVTGLVATWGTLSAAFGGSASVLGAIVGLLGGPVTAAVLAIAAAIGLFAAAWAGNWGNIQGVMSGVIAQIEPVFQQFIANIGLFVQQIQPGIDAFIGAIQNMAPVFSAVAAVVGGVLVAALSGLGNTLPWLGMLFSGLLTAVSGVMNTITAIITGFVAIVTALFQGDLQGAGQAALTMFTNIGNGIIQVLTGLGSSAYAIVAGLVDAIIGFFTTLYHEVVGGSIVPDMVNGIIEVISSLPGAVLGVISGLVADAISSFEGFKTEAAALWVGVKEVASTAISDLATFVGEQAASIASKAASVGSGIVDGIRKGISDGWEALKNFVSQKAAELLAAAKGALGIGSPSKLFREEVGPPIPEGTGLGIQDAMPELIAAMHDAFASLTDAAKSDAEDLAKIYEDALGGIANLDRSRISANNALSDLFPDPKQLDDLKKKMADIEAERARLQVTAQQNDDPAKRADAEKRLLELDKERAETQRQIGDITQQNAQKQAFAQQAQAMMQEAERQSLQMRAQDPEMAADFFKMRQSQILELAKMQQDLADADSPEERARIQENLRLLQEAQLAERARFESQSSRKENDFQDSGLSQVFNVYLTAQGLSGNLKADIQRMIDAAMKKAAEEAAARSRGKK
jgi:phage-related protein